MKIFCVLVAVFLCGNLSAKDISIQLTVQNCRSSEGNMVVSAFASQEEFKLNKPKYKKIISKRAAMKEMVFRTEIILPEGDFGITVGDDTNGNHEMDYDMLGRPLEGFGFSNYLHKGLTRPTIDDFKIHVCSGLVQIVIQLKYFK